MPLTLKITIRNNSAKKAGLGGIDAFPIKRAAINKINTLNLPSDFIKNISRDKIECLKEPPVKNIPAETQACDNDKIIMIIKAFDLELNNATNIKVMCVTLL